MNRPLDHSHDPTPGALHDTLSGKISLVVAALALPNLAAAQTPIDGFLPMVGIALTDEFDDDFNFFPTSTVGTGGGTLLGAGGVPNYDIALLDTGAGFSLLTDQAFSEFGLDAPSPGESDGYVGSEFVTIGGATGQLLVPINDPFGLYASGLQDRTGEGAAFAMNTATLPGQTNTSTLTFPAESPLPNVVGLPFASQYATSIRSDQPQIFELDGRTVRTPAIEFQPLGSGGGSITRKAPLNLNPGSVFVQPPAYVLNIANFDIDNPQENPSIPTITQGALFLNANASNDGSSLGTKEFFFDTGASVTVLSSLNALSLGFDVVADTPEFTVSVVGSGGVAEDVPGFFVDEITLVALGGSITATDVPVLVLDVTDPSDPGNTVEGIIGTNLLARRNVVIDPNPSTGGGGASAGVYISDPVTTDFEWAVSGPLGFWGASSSWDAGAPPTYLSVTRVGHQSGAVQVAGVAGEQQAWEVFVEGGAAGEEMGLLIVDNAKLTTFSGTTVLENAFVELAGGTLDTQYLDLRGGALVGDGLVTTGSGPIDGQVEVVEGGLVAPGDGAAGRITVEGRYSQSENGTLEIGLGGIVAAELHDQLVVDGTASLAGELIVSLIDSGGGSFEPTPGMSFDILLYEQRGGAFDTITLPSGYVWDVSYGSTSLTLSVLGVPGAGDFNADGVVDLADYTTWRDGLGDTYTQADYQIWVDNFGQTSAPIAAGVPEPAVFLILLVGVTLTLARR